VPHRPAPSIRITASPGPGTSDAKVNLFGFQPVEAIKILVVLFLAGYFFDRWEFLRELPETRALPGPLARLGIPKLEYLLPPVAAIVLVLVFFFLQRDLGPAIVLAFLFLSLYCIARGQPWMALVGTALIVIAFWIGYRLGIPRTVSGRLSMWLSPWDNSFRGGDHLAQSLWALAGGAFSGTGLGLGQPQRVPAVHTDLVLAAIGEELGFVGLAVVVALYVVLVLRGFRAAYRAQGVYSFFLALGLTVLVAFQILLIAGGVVGVLPLSGVVAPRSAINIFRFDNAQVDIFQPAWQLGQPDHWHAARGQPRDDLRVDRPRVGAAVVYPFRAAGLDAHNVGEHGREIVRRAGQPQLPDRLAQQLARELIARALGHHQPIADDHNAVGQLLGLG